MFRIYWGYIRAVFLAVCLALAITAVFETEKVTGTSMEPAVYSGDRVILNKAVYLFDEPKVGDIVVFARKLHTETDGGALLIKRVFAVAGDEVEQENGEVIEISQGHIYVLGDNSEVSLDSRNPAIGQIKVEEVIGRVELCLLPLERFGRLQ